MSGFMKTVLIPRQAPWHFSKKIHRFFHSIDHSRPSTHSLLTNLACVWLAACWLLRLQGMAGRVSPAKKISNLSDQNASLFVPALPPGVRAWGTGLVWAGSQSPGLSATTLHNPPSPYVFLLQLILANSVKIISIMHLWVLYDWWTIRCV